VTTTGSTEHSLPTTIDLDLVSYSDFICDKWGRVCAGLGVAPSEWTPITDILRRLFVPWGQRPIGRYPTYRSYVTDSRGLPFELSVDWSQRGPVLRLMWEPLEHPEGPRTCADAGAELIRRLDGEPGVSLDRYLAVEDLFLPDPKQATVVPAKSVVWHGLYWRPGEMPTFRVYLSPQVHAGADQAEPIVSEAMGRLGLDREWAPVRERHGELAESGHDLRGVAVDLTASSDARVKAYYVSREGATAAEIDRLAGFALRHSSARFHAAYRHIVGHDGPSRGNPPTIGLAFVSGYDGPLSANVCIPLPGNVDSDEQASRRIAKAMSEEGGDPSTYLRSLNAVSDRPLGESIGLQEYVAWRSDVNWFGICVYLHFSVWG
jgi:DMATS type aromatic prenyltransferase